VVSEYRVAVCKARAKVGKITGGQQSVDGENRSELEVYGRIHARPVRAECDRGERKRRGVAGVRCAGHRRQALLPEFTKRVHAIPARGELELFVGGGRCYRGDIADNGRDDAPIPAAVRAQVAHGVIATCDDNAAR